MKYVNQIIHFNIIVLAVVEHHQQKRRSLVCKCGYLHTTYNYDTLHTIKFIIMYMHTTECKCSIIIVASI